MIHIKPFIYYHPYFIGCIMGYLIYTNNVNKVLSSSKFKILAKLSLMTFFSSILFNVLSITVIEPSVTFAAIDASLSLICLSIIFINVLAQMPNKQSIKAKLNSPWLSVFKQIQRVSYLVHPLTMMIFFHHIQFYDWNMDIVSILTMLQNVTIYFIMQTLFSIILTLFIANPLSNYIDHVTKAIFEKANQ